MSRFERWKKPLLSLVTAVIVLTGGWFVLSPIRQSKALQLVSQANQIHQSDPKKAIAMLKVANFLKLTQAGTIRLAQDEIEIGESAEALTVLAKAPHHDTAYWLNEGEALLEMGRADEAKSALANSSDPKASEILASLKLPEAVVLANKLVGLQLPHSAERALVTAKTLNSSGVALLAQIRLSLNENLPNTRSRLESALKNDPANLQLHMLLRQTEQRIGDQKAAFDEAVKIQALKSGKI